MANTSVSLELKGINSEINEITQMLIFKLLLQSVIVVIVLNLWLTEPLCLLKLEIMSHCHGRTALFQA